MFTVIAVFVWYLSSPIAFISKNAFLTKTHLKIYPLIKMRFIFGQILRQLFLSPDCHVEGKPKLFCRQEERWVPQTACMKNITLTCGTARKKYSI